MSEKLNSELPIASNKGIELGVELQTFSSGGWLDTTVRILRPFSWDAKNRAFEIEDLPITEGKSIILVAGPYATSDAAAWNLDPSLDVGFPENEDYDGVLYLVHGKPSEKSDVYQDAAGWFLISGTHNDKSKNFVSIALERSNTQLVLLELAGGVLSVSLILPKQVYPIESCRQLIDYPKMQIRVGSGTLFDGQQELREMIRDAMPPRARAYESPLIVDTWGFETNVSQDLVAEVAKTAKLLELEILTIDKGWESAVGDWNTGHHFPDGLKGLRNITSDKGIRLGLWASLGNADPLSSVATSHPEWIATWRGKTQIVSHHTNSLCLGHGPVIDYLAESLVKLAEGGLTWLLHDFETISRCDSQLHDHPAGLGEDWAVRGWYRLLSEFRARFPDVWIENCWNGGKPLDLQMVAHHDTTIGDDWCDVRHNAVAKVGLGQFLPAHWCSSYMSDQNDLPLESQLAIYAVGGPWILMGDIPNWSEEKLELVKRVMRVYRSWRPLFPEGSVDWSKVTGWEADASWRADQEVLAISFLHPSGKELMAGIICQPLAVGEIRLYPKFSGAVTLTDEFTGISTNLTPEQVSEGIAILTDQSKGYLLSVTPK